MFYLATSMYGMVLLYKVNCIPVVVNTPTWGIKNDDVDKYYSCSCSLVCPFCVEQKLEHCRQIPTILNKSSWDS